MKIARSRTAFAALFASAAFIASPAMAQTADGATADDGNDDIIVTAQKREESLQDVPISVQVLGTRRLDQLNITNFAQYTQMLSSVAFQSSQPGQTSVYIRGVASGGDGNHSGSLPSVGVYLDEQAVTTIGGTLDVHIYDIARIESLAGPQGTLYGASSEAGTLRIITNKPSLSGFEGRVDGEINTVAHGGIGGRIEGMVNAPLNDMMALRVVGFYQHDAGYVDNVAGTRTFLPTPGGITVNNAAFVEDNYNDTTIAGGRAALKIDLDDTWTVTPSVIAQDQRSHGSYGFDPRVGDLQVQHFFPEYRHDRFVQAAMTIEGQLGNWDLTYAGAYLDRRVNQSSDYTDYAEAYDSLYASVGGLASYFYLQNAAGATIDPRQQVLGTDHFRKMSHELRVSSPQDERFRVTAGAFYQRQTNEIHQDYQVAGLGPNLSVNGFPGTLWLTQQHRTDRDYAMFGEASYDITPALTLTVGGRGFIYDNSLIGFFGFGRNPGNGFSDGPPNGAGSNRTGVAQCFTTAGERLYDRDSDTYSSSLTLLPAAVAGSPCTNLATYAIGTGLRPVNAEGQGFTHRVNLTWKPNDDMMLYGIWSRGFRPGGINRRADVAPYASDYLTNFELGWKMTMGPVRFNGAVYQQNWNSFQFSYLGANSFTEIHNGPNARIRGVEVDVNYSANGLTLSGSASYTDARTRQNLCAVDDATFACSAAGNFVAAAAGTRLPVTPRLKSSMTARYAFDMGGGRAYFQAVGAYQGSAASDLRTAIIEAGTGNTINPAALQGRLASFFTAGLSVGAEWDALSLDLFVTNLFDERGQLARFQQCGSCGQRPYIVSNTPRTIGLRAGLKF